MAVAGFSADELDITAQENTLLVTGKAKKDQDENRYLHRGIARRAFERRFSLADHIKVVGASLVSTVIAARIWRWKSRTLRIVSGRISGTSP